jgi:hypothetical protein
VNRQAAMIAYIDDFWLMTWLTLAAAPLVVFMKKADLRRRALPRNAAPEPAAEVPH